jgi:cytochrome c oxidase subunit II
VCFAALATASLLLCGCGGSHSIVSTHSPQTHLVALLWWWMLGAASVVFFGAVGLLVLAYVRRGRKGLPFVGEREDLAGGMVVLFGIAVPLVVLVVLFGAANLYVIESTAAPSPRSTRLTVDVVGHQWWWEIHYPQSGVVTANEIHVPVDTRVDVVATSADVIHSFWVPALARKIDMIPGRENHILLYASAPGVYRGQCSEFCGLAHAYMALKVFAEAPSSFKTWLAHTSQPARAPAGAQASKGEQLFMSRQCSSCHEIGGTSAQATVGPSLTHVASRTSLAAATIANDPRELAAWIENPQAIKPGDRMPALGLSASEVSAIVAYLEELR